MLIMCLKTFGKTVKLLKNKVKTVKDVHKILFIPLYLPSIYPFNTQLIH